MQLTNVRNLINMNITESLKQLQRSKNMRKLMNYLYSYISKVDNSKGWIFQIYYQENEYLKNKYLFENYLYNIFIFYNYL